MVAASGGNPLAFLANAVGLTGSKFSGLNVKRVYFGNWLSDLVWNPRWLDSRDYSQAVDVGTLGRGIKLGTIRILVWVMGFMAHGYATEEFEVRSASPLELLESHDVLKNWFNKSDGTCSAWFNLLTEGFKDLFAFYLNCTDYRSTMSDSVCTDLRNILV